MSDALFRGPDRDSLQTLPRLTPRDRQALERILWLAPDVAVSTASAVLRSNQPQIERLLFAERRAGPVAQLGTLARALCYLALAMSAPGQGKILPILTPDHIRQANDHVRVLLQSWGRATAIGARELVESEAIPDVELRGLLDALVEGVVRRTLQDPRWIRTVVYGEAAAFYQILDRACSAQFGGAVDLESINQQLARIVDTRAMLLDTLAGDTSPRQFDPRRQNEQIERLRRYGWREFQLSDGRTLRDIAAEARQKGLAAHTTFALSDEWLQHGASEPTNGHRYFVRPSLLPDSEGLALWAQEERLKPLQKMLAGDSAETGLRLRLGTVEFFLEYVVRTDQRQFLDGRWTRTANRFNEMQTRFGEVTTSGYAITLFPGARWDAAVGVCPVIEVAVEAS